MKNFLTVFSDNRSSLFIQHCPNLCIRAFTLLSDPFFNRPPSLTDYSFGLSDKKKLTLSTFQVSDVTGKLITVASYLNGLLSTTTARNSASSSSSMSGLGKEAVSSRVSGSRYRWRSRGSAH